MAVNGMKKGAAVIVGDPSKFAIESSISHAYEHPGQRALGFFLIYVNGKSYGVRASNASMLACSYDAVKERVAGRGTHRAPLISDQSAENIADAMRASYYDGDRQDEKFFGLSAEEFVDTIFSARVWWAPDGDEAFDDGGHVLQFDQDGKARVIAFKNVENVEDLAGTVADIWLTSDEFYGILEAWQRKFENEWEATLERQKSEKVVYLPYRHPIKVKKE